MMRQMNLFVDMEPIRYSLYTIHCPQQAKKVSIKMKDSILFTKSKAFALRVVRL